MFCKLKNNLPKTIFIFLLFIIIFGALTVRAWLTTDPMKVIPPDSFIKEGLVLTLIEEDEKYYLKKEYFTNEGTYASPASEQQISYEDYALMRSNGTYDILEKRNRHIINDVYVDEFYRAYADNEVMAGNYIAEVLDGFFVNLTYPDGHRSQQVGFINDGGIHYKVTKFVDENGNYTKNAVYDLLSQYEYEQAKLSTPFDFEKIVEWKVSDDGNTITKTISNYDNEGNYLVRPIVLQMTGFDNLEEFIKPEDIPDDKPTPTPTVTSTPSTTVVPSPTLVIITPTPTVSVTVSPTVTKTPITTKPSTSTPIPSVWGGEQVKLEDSGGAIQNIVSNFTDSIADSSAESGATDNDLTPEVVQGIYDDAGNFIPIDSDGNIILGEPGVFDEDGNFTPNAGSGYYDSEGVWHPTEIIPGVYDEEGNFVTDEGTYDEEGNFIPDGGNEESSLEGAFIDDKGNLIMPDGTVITPDGVVHGAGVESELIDSNGFEVLKPYGKLTLDFNGNVVIWNEDGYYDEDGLCHLSDGTVGYYDLYGRFTKSRINPYSKTENGFYDVNGEFHPFNTIYKTENGTTQLILLPDIGLTVTSSSVSIADSSYTFTPNGLVTIGEDIGYFNSDGDFLKSDRNAYKGGFFDEKGRWIDDFLIRLDNTKSASLSNGYFDKYGVYTTPNNDKGYFNESGEFIINRENPFGEGYYDWAMGFTNFGKIYYDNLGNIHKTGSDEIIATDGSIVIAESQKGIKDKNNNWFNAGIVITEKGYIGHYNEFAEFKEGQIPYAEGYYDCEGNFFRYDGIVILADGTVGYFDENGEFHEGVQNGLLDENGNYILPDGTVITPDGIIGYYDENGVFHEGENPYVGGYYDAEGNWHSLSEEGYVDKNGNTVLPNGVVVGPDGTLGYYDENGNFVSLEELPEGAWVDEDGVIHLADGTMILPDGTKILPDGTVVLPDGTIGYYDENGVFHEGLPEGAWVDENGVTHLADGTMILPDGTVILPDGTVILPDGTVTTGYIDENGNLVLADGTVITPDGKVGYYDENGVFHEGESPYVGGYYDENGVWHELAPEEGIPYEGGYYDENGVWHSFDELPEGAYIDKNGNLVMPDGTVITPDGRIGYYDENGVFHEGESPYEGGYYDENGNWISTGYYDAEGNYIMSDGTIVMPDGTVILPDGTVVSGYIDENGKLVITDNLSGTGYYDEAGNLLSGENPDANGFYDSEGNYYLAGDDGYYDENGTYHAADGTIGYYDENGVWHEGENPYVNGFYDENGVWHGTSEEQTVLGYYDENGVWHEGVNPYEGGYYDENGVWHSYDELGYVDSNGNTVLPNGVVLNEDGVAGYYDENGIWHEGPIPYEGGYYDENGVWHELETDANGNVILPDGTVIGPDGQVIGVMGTTTYENDEPLVAYYDAEGNLLYGTENPYEGGYYDAEGNWHSNTSDVWIDANGNAHMQTESIGYYDAEGNFHLNGDDGYYDENGTYHAADGTIGYYDENGVWHEGENPYPDGYYDSEGNWHPTGEIGYFDENGVWHESVSNDVVGYYDENGVWHEGVNPYVNGYYDENGVWHGEGDPLKAYYDANGELQYGESPYADGWYDAEGNWHPNDGEGYFDSTGTYHTKDGDIGYYDADGIWHEGTNPYLYGYYDSEGNWHPAGDAGYYDVNGTYHAANGTIGYYDENGVWHEGQENPYEGGYYDANGNFHPFDENGYYDKDGNFHSNVYIVDKYTYGDDDYIYFTGRWRTDTENAQYRLAGKTVQYTINKKSVNKIYSDTGIYVGLNAILEYEEIKDILHMIAISTDNKFVQDKGACMLIYNGRMISVTDEDKLTVRTLQKIFENTNIEITIAKTRLGKKFAMIDAIENKRDIKLKFDDLIMTPENPLLVIDNEAYIALNDVSDIIFYDYSIKPAGPERKLTFRLKKSIPYEDLRSYMAQTITFTTNDGAINYESKNGKDLTERYTKLKPTLITLESGYTTTYIPIKLIPRFTGCNACYDVNKCYIDLNYSKGLPLIQQFYDTSEDIVGDNGLGVEVDSTGTPIIANNNGNAIQETIIKQETNEEWVDDTDYGEIFNVRGQQEEIE